MHAYMDSLYTALGVFAPDRCQLHYLGRAEMFRLQEQCGGFRTGRHRHGHGYTLTAVLMASIREILGSGTGWASRSCPRAWPR